jgi:hypothetical protein
MSEVLISTLLGGLLALAGALIGPNLQRKHDRWLAKRQDEALLRDKAEELFEELDRMQQGSRRAMLSVMASVRDPSEQVQPIPELGKIRAIVCVYFESASKIVNEFERQRDSSGQIFMDYTKEQFEQKCLTEDRTKMLQLYMVSEHGKNLSAFVTKLRSHVSHIVPRVKS